MKNEEDFKAKVRELFEQVADRLEPQLDKMIQSGCGIVDDHVANGSEYLVAKAFLCAFLENEKDRYTPSRINKTFDELLDNYEKFI